MTRPENDHFWPTPPWLRMPGLELAAASSDCQLCVVNPIHFAQETTTARSAHSSWTGQACSASDTRSRINPN